MRRHFAIGFLHRLRPAADVISQFVGSEIRGSEPGSRLETDDFKSGPRERKRSHAAHGAEPDDDDVRLLQVNRHGRPPLSTLALAGRFFENIGSSYADLWVGVRFGSRR